MIMNSCIVIGNQCASNISAQSEYGKGVRNSMMVMMMMNSCIVINNQNASKISDWKVSE